MLGAASRLLGRLDVVGVSERLDGWLELVCARAGISPCGALRRINERRTTGKTQGCPPPDAHALQRAVRTYALADVRLHALATRRFQADWERLGLRRADE